MSGSRRGRSLRSNRTEWARPSRSKRSGPEPRLTEFSRRAPGAPWAADHAEWNCERHARQNHRQWVFELVVPVDVRTYSLFSLVKQMRSDFAITAASRGSAWMLTRHRKHTRS